MANKFTHFGFMDSCNFCSLFFAVLVLGGAGAKAEANLLLSASNEANDYGWQMAPSESYEIKGAGEVSIDLDSRLNVDGAGGSKRTWRVLGFSADNPSDGIWRLSGWLKVYGGNYGKDPIMTVSVQGGNGLREMIREYNSKTDWTYFEKRMRLPEGLDSISLSVNYWASDGSAEVRGLSFERDIAPSIDFSVESVRTQNGKWREESCSYRLSGTFDGEANSPVWVDVDFQRLLLLAGSRSPVNPSSLVVWALRENGSSVPCPLAFDQAIGSLAENYARNGILKWRSVAGAIAYEVYFNASGPEGPRPLPLSRMLGIGEVLTHQASTLVPLWSGWPGTGIESVDADADGVWDLMLTSTDGGRFMARNVGSLVKPIFIPRMRELPADDLPTAEVKNKLTVDWLNNGEAAVLELKKYRKGTYVDGATATIELKQPGFSKTSLMTSDGETIVLDDATWAHLDEGDFDGDGLLDLVVGSSRADILILVNREELGHGVVEPFYLDFDLFKESPHSSGDMGLKPSVVDWDGDGRQDLLITGWSGNCWLFMNDIIAAGGPLQFLKPKLLLQEGGPLVVADSPVVWIVDWDNDGVNDLLTGDVNGRFTIFRSTGTVNSPTWSAPQSVMTVDGAPLMITPVAIGADEAVQGPAEMNWGYVSVATWDLTGDGLFDLIVNDSLGQLSWIENVGEVGLPIFSNEVHPFLFKGEHFLTPWRNAPAVFDWNGNGLPELLVLNDKGELVMLHLSDSVAGVIDEVEPMLDFDNEPLVVNMRTSHAGTSGRSNLTVGDINNDGLPDVLVGASSIYTNGGSFLLCLNVGASELPRFKLEPLKVGDGVMAEWVGSDGHTQWHNGGPRLFDWNGDGKVDLFHGVESGRITYYSNDYLNLDEFGQFSLSSFERYNSSSSGDVIWDFGKGNDTANLPVGKPLEQTPLQWLPNELQQRQALDEVKSLKFLTPKPGERVAGNIKVEAVVSNRVSIIKFYLNGEFVATESRAPYIMFGDGQDWDTTTVPDGMYELAVVATFSDGKSLMTTRQVIEVSNDQ